MPLWCCFWSGKTNDRTIIAEQPDAMIQGLKLADPNTDRSDVVGLLAPVDRGTLPFDLNGTSGWCRIVNVHDGDTCTAVLFVQGLGFRRVQVRLAGIDTAEMTSKDPLIKRAAIDARDLLIASVAPGASDTDKENKAKLAKYFDTNISIAWLECQGGDKYGRTLGVIRTSPGSKSVNELLLERGLATVYDGGNKQAAWAAKPGGTNAEP